MIFCIKFLARTKIYNSSLMSLNGSSFRDNWRFFSVSEPPYLQISSSPVPNALKMAILKHPFPSLSSNKGWTLPFCHVFGGALLEITPNKDLKRISTRDYIKTCILRSGPRLLDIGEWNCEEGCRKYGFSCNVNFKTMDTTNVFTRALVHCNDNNEENAVWNMTYHPLFRPSESSNHTGDCVGYKNVPKTIQCNISAESIREEDIGSRRLCDCIDFSKLYGNFLFPCFEYTFGICDDRLPKFSVWTY